MRPSHNERAAPALAGNGPHDADRLASAIKKTDKPRVIRRQGRCRHCDLRFDLSTTGRQKQFCSERCRVASAREKAVFERAGCITPGVTKPPSQVIENIASLGTKKQTHACLFNVPLDLLGRGHRWPGAKRIETATIEKIRVREIGGAR